MSSGNFAVVFKMKDESSGKLYAVKCFLREQEGRDIAYQQITDELEYVSSNYLCSIKYFPNELFVDSTVSSNTEFPVLLMDWAEGITLDKYVHQHILGMTCKVRTGKQDIPFLFLVIDNCSHFSSDELIKPWQRYKKYSIYHSY